MTAVEFKREHFIYLLDHGITDKKLKPWLKAEHADDLENSQETYTLLDDGIPVLVGGVRQYWYNRAEAWVLLGEPKREKWVELHRRVQQFLDVQPYKRIEMIVDYDFEEGHRWARLLGFHKEASIMRHYRSDGGDVSLYAKIKDEP